MHLFRFYPAPLILAVCLASIPSHTVAEPDFHPLRERVQDVAKASSLPLLHRGTAPYTKFLETSDAMGLVISGGTSTSPPPQWHHKRTPPHPVHGLNLPPGWTTIYTVSTAFMPIRAASTALLALYNGAYTKAVLWTIRSYDANAQKMTILLGSLKLTFVASRGFPEFSTIVALFAQRMMVQTLAGFTGRYWIEFLAPPDAKGDRLRVQVVLSVIGDVGRNIGAAP